MKKTVEQMSLRVPTLVKDSLLDVGQLTTRVWTIDDVSLLCFDVLFLVIYYYTLDRVSPWSIARPCA